VLYTETALNHPFERRVTGMGSGVDHKELEMLYIVNRLKIDESSKSTPLQIPTASSDKVKTRLDKPSAFICSLPQFGKLYMTAYFLRHVRAKTSRRHSFKARKQYP
jgi:hypothetical protein